jgi:hypothetical protein
MILEGLTILMIGSSHLAKPGYLISTLHDQMQNSGAQMHTIGVCGSLPSAWVMQGKGNCGSAERLGDGPIKINIGESAKNHNLNQLIKATPQKKVLIVVMGDTLANYSAPNLSIPFVKMEVNHITAVVKESQINCFWVGPSWGTEGGSSKKSHKRVEQLSNLLSESVGPCKYIDSLKMFSPNQLATVDGQHYTSKGYDLWGKQLFQVLSKEISDIK